MSELQNPTSRPVSPTQAPTPSRGSDSAAEVYRRAVEAKPTGFAENPIGAMAQAVDRLGRAAGGVLSSKSMEGKDGLDAAESKLKAAIAEMRKNPGSIKAKQAALQAGLDLLQQMSKLKANDPRKVSVAKFLVGLANQLSEAGQLPTSLRGLDVRGLLRSAAQILSRFGSSQDMQAAFKLEHLITTSLPAQSSDAVAARDELMQRLGLSTKAKAVISSGWAVKLAGSGEMPNLDMDARTIVIDASKENPSLGVLARAFWHDKTMQNAEEKDGFIEAFNKIANQGTIVNLSRKYRELREHARRELQQAQVGLGKSSSTAQTDESADMFGSLAIFTHREDQAALPSELSKQLDDFYAVKS